MGRESSLRESLECVPPHATTEAVMPQLEQLGVLWRFSQPDVTHGALRGSVSIAASLYWNESCFFPMEHYIAEPPCNETLCSCALLRILYMLHSSGIRLRADICQPRSRIISGGKDMCTPKSLSLSRPLRTLVIRLHWREIIMNIH